MQRYILKRHSQSGLFIILLLWDIYYSPITWTAWMYKCSCLTIVFWYCWAIISYAGKLFVHLDFRPYYELLLYLLKTVIKVYAIIIFFMLHVFFYSYMYFNVKTINEIIQHCDHVQKVILKVISDISIKKYTRNILVSRVIASMHVCLTLIVSFYTME